VLMERIDLAARLVPRDRGHRASNVTIDTTVNLDEGDLMILYTDGITEARNKAGKMPELDGLVEILTPVVDRTPEEIRDHVLAKTREWMKEQADDISIVVLRRARQRR
jgi:phosphoserine phosphatase RsbU/P